MKILCKHHPDVMGLAMAFDKLGHETFLWQDTPAFDIFDEINPDVFVLTTKADRAMEKCIEERPDMHTMIQVDPNMWILDGEETEFPNVVDDISFHHVEPNPNMASDITYIGSPNPMIMSLAYPIGKFNLKIFGPHPWPIPQYLGFIGTDEHCQAYSSAKIVFVTNMTEALRAINCKAFCLTDREDIAEELDMNCVEEGNIEDMYGMVNACLEEPEGCQQWVDEHYPAMEKATYTILLKHILETVFK